MVVDLTDRDREVLRSLLKREWGTWDACREQAPNPKAERAALQRQHELTDLMAKLTYG